MEIPADFRLQAAEWRKAASRHGGAIGQALRIASDLLEVKAAVLERAAVALESAAPAPDPLPPAPRSSS